MCLDSVLESQLNLLPLDLCASVVKFREKCRMGSIHAIPERFLPHSEVPPKRRILAVHFFIEADAGTKIPRIIL